MNDLKSKKRDRNGRVFLLAGVAGIEPTIKVLETFVIPFNYTPYGLVQWLLYTQKGNEVNLQDKGMMLSTNEWHGKGDDVC